MLRQVKLATLAALRSSGIFRLVANSDWRQRRLSILCYHGTSLEDEHLWRPSLYIHPKKLEQRLESLKRGGYSVLPLGEGLQRLRAGTLPPRSVALTFDDGTYDFFRQAYPLLQAYGFPVTVYQTTYYACLQQPVFNLICPYMLWKRRGEVIADGAEIGVHSRLDLRTEAGRRAVMLDLIPFSERGDRTGLQKDEIAAQLARILKIDYDELKAKRILQVMNAREVREIARNGVDVQLHTHRHRTPEDETLFRKEIQDNRSRIREWAATEPIHFCYPSGVYRPAFLPWLREEHVVSATTCDFGLATRRSDSLLLPRFIDSQNRTQIEFESWVTGVGDLLAVRRRATQKYVPGRS
ncbi:MAG TPA: polysaccharide deacetylase family protein [Candidatus Acidoferrum sp.]|jgi:peptidoglycan/xylan/chitin deacetylase (PgdA/CDA1 family)|nr:polysaccharide deacetylase family protein [Candidatus Acidoferrum sp.]